ncbi:hypothetical protein CVT26_003675 [Gymnopilus dilepis]|uniref:Uncharacterized protein n=1 Tax=Gymnopilus dilepis TaxID=231916 RepID=A0A409X1L5_9AGAR|nr:hypothetical protein CVT26_003675 [Gymnopilus dilepis]
MSQADMDPVDTGPLHSAQTLLNDIILETWDAVNLSDDQWATAAKNARKRLTNFHKDLCRDAVPEISLDTIELLLAAFSNLSSTPDSVRGVVRQVLESLCSESNRDILGISETHRESMVTTTPDSTSSQNLLGCELGPGGRSEVIQAIHDEVNKDKREISRPISDSADLIGNISQDGASTLTGSSATQDPEVVRISASAQLSGDSRVGSTELFQGNTSWRLILKSKANTCTHKDGGGQPSGIVGLAGQAAPKTTWISCSEAELGLPLKAWEHGRADAHQEKGG